MLDVEPSALETIAHFSKMIDISAYLGSGLAITVTPQHTSEYAWNNPTVPKILTLQ